MSATIFERIVTGADVEAWCSELLLTWFGTYLSEVERQRGMTPGTLARPRGLVLANGLDKWPEDQLPALLLVSVGTAEAPLKEGDGTYRARWDVGAACVCSARTEADSRTQAMLYIAALRALFVQRPSLDGWADGTVWTGETYDAELDYDDLRTLAAGIAAFTVEVRGVTTANAGPVTPEVPIDPDTEAWPPWPEVITPEVEVRNQPLPGDLPKQGWPDLGRRARELLTRRTA